MKIQKKLSDINPAEYDILFFAGGHGVMWDLPDNVDVQYITKEIFENGGIVSAVCHGPAALVNVRLSNGEFLISGKQVTGFTNEEENAVELEAIVPFLLEDKMKARKAKYHSTKMFEEFTAQDDRLITGQNPQSAKAVGERVVAEFRKLKLHKKIPA